MIGFLACILVEAATGRGIIGQIVLYLKVRREDAKEHRTPKLK